MKGQKRYGRQLVMKALAVFFANGRPRGEITQDDGGIIEMVGWASNSADGKTRMLPVLERCRMVVEVVHS